MPPPSSSHHALIVEDDLDLCQLLDVILSRNGFECVTVRSVPEALQKVSDHEFDSILLDLAMPQVSGLDFIEKIRADRPALLPRILVVTGLAPREWESADMSEIHGIVRKPFVIDELVREVKACSTRPV